MTKRVIANFMRAGLVLTFSLVLYGCGAGSANQSLLGPREAQGSNIAIAANTPGVTPFISSVQLVGSSISHLVSVAFNISPKPGSVSKAVNVTWSMGALSARGYVHGNGVSLPVFGLYANYQNLVKFTFTFDDGSAQLLQYTIATPAYTDQTGIYINPTILKARAPGSTLGFSFFVLKSLLGSPVIVDTDGEVRWVVPAAGTTAVYFGNGQFVEGSNTSPNLALLQFDGTQSVLSSNVLPQPPPTDFNHNIDPGREGLFVDLDGTDSLGISLQDIVSEISPFSNQGPFQTFDMATILTTYMQANGDAPTSFVRPGVDWFHVNSSTYDPSDNSIIISSRENFLIKLDYSTHDIMWILGDPTKYWYTFPSLRAKALLLDSGSLYPVGQHSVSITSDGYIMVMNDGYGSLNQPNGEPAGITRTYSAVSAYSVNSSAMTAREVWDFDYGQSIYSPVCGSSYEAPGKTYLVTYAAVDNGSEARLVGLDSNLNVAFDFQYTSPSGCSAAWNAIPITLENLQID